MRAVMDDDLRALLRLANTTLGAAQSVCGRAANGQRIGRDEALVIGLWCETAHKAIRKYCGEDAVSILTSDHHPLTTRKG